MGRVEKKQTPMNNNQGKEIRGVAKIISMYDKGMAEYFMQHNYRLMYELWQKVKSELSSLPAHPLNVEKAAEEYAESNCEWIRNIHEYNTSNDIQKGFIAGAKWSEGDVAYWKSRCEAAEKVINALQNPGERGQETFNKWQSLKQKQ